MVPAASRSTWCDTLPSSPGSGSSPKVVSQCPTFLPPYLYFRTSTFTVGLSSVCVPGGSFSELTQILTTHGTLTYMTASK